MNFANLWTATYETILMTLISALLAYLVGIPLGICLNITSKSGLHPHKVINTILGVFVNLLRSIPCLLLIIILLPLTRAIFHIGSGEWHTMLIPLFFASFPFVARLVEQSLSEVPADKVEAIRSMGATNREIVFKVLLAEAKPSLISGFAVSSISILGYTAFAYDFGAGGLISSAFSYYRSHPNTYLSDGPNVWIIVFLVVIIVQIIQETGLYLARKTDKRRVIS